MGYDLTKPADLTLWPKDAPAKIADCRECGTLRDALEAALAAFAGGKLSSWIITEDGDILTPGWIEANAADLLRPDTAQADFRMAA